MASQLAIAGEINLVHLGVMSDDCTKINKTENAPLMKFDLMPVEAADVVKSNSSTGCFVKMGLGVYADNLNYYFVNNNLLFGKAKNEETIKKYSFIVQANTGKLIAIPEYEK